VINVIKVNIHQLKSHFSKYLDHVAQGETILLCKRNIPIAEIRPVPQARKSKRPLGLARNELKIPTSFLKSLPDELFDAFEGKP
jgi:antitoxin (DNA-binding transcriptional repressor) of toxin-antitoxin stability system